MGIQAYKLDPLGIALSMYVGTQTQKEIDRFLKEKSIDYLSGRYRPDGRYETVTVSEAFPNARVAFACLTQSQDTTPYIKAGFEVLPDFKSLPNWAHGGETYLTLLKYVWKEETKSE